MCLQLISELFLCQGEFRVRVWHISSFVVYSGVHVRSRFIFQRGETWRCRGCTKCTFLAGQQLRLFFRGGSGSRPDWLSRSRTTRREAYNKYIYWNIIFALQFWRRIGTGTEPDRLFARNFQTRIFWIFETRRYMRECGSRTHVGV